MSICEPERLRIKAADIDHLSWSAIKSCYSACPRRYAYRYLEKAPEEFAPASLKFGSAFHCVVEHIHQRRLEGTSQPDEAEALNVFEARWSEAVSDTSVRYSKGEDSDSLRATAARMLAAYCKHLVDTNSSDGSQIVAIEHGTRFRLLADVPPIEARLDLLELQGTDLVVSDLKTSRNRWNETKVFEAIPQLVLYATSLLPLMRELGANRIVTKFVVVTKAKVPVVQVLQPKATQDDVFRLKETIAETWEAIQTGVFPKRESWACEQCPYRGRCLGR